MTILVRIGRALTIIGNTNGVELGSAASFVFRAVGGIDPMTLEVMTETFGAEWAFDDSVAGQITLSTAAASVPGTFSFTLRANDAVREPVEREFSITVAADPLVLSGAFAEANQGDAYSDSITVSGGISPYSWAVISGSLPPGLSLGASTGILSGTPTAPGSPSLFDFTVRVTDSAGTTATSVQRMNVTPPLGDPDALEVLASLVDWQDFVGTSDLTSKVKAVTWALAGDGSQAMSSVTGPNGIAANAIRITGSAGNRLEMPSDDDDFDVADTDHWWTCGVYVYTSSGTRDLYLKNVAWRFRISGTQFIADGPVSAVANGPSSMTAVWKIVTCWRQAGTDKVYMDVDGTTYESSGTGTPIGNTTRVSVRGGGTNGVAFARVGFGKGAYLGASARAYLRNSNAGKLYSEILTDAGL